MSNQFLKLRRSSVPGRVPTTSSLEFGEIALNTYDGLAFLKKSGSNGEEIVAIGATATISGSQYFIPVFSGSGVTESTIFQSGSFIGFPNATAPLDPNYPDLLFISASGIDTYNLISAHSDRDGYVQLNVQNFSLGNEGSSDIVASANNATENSYYVDMGINNENYANNNLVGFANDAYIYSTGNDLLIGNASTGRRVVIFNGGLNAEANAKIFVHEQGTVGINTNVYNVQNPPSLFVVAPNSTTFNVIQSQADTDGFTEVSHANKNSGISASADFVAYNDIDPTGQESGYVDVGINSTNYAYNGEFPGTAGDAYAYTDSHHFILGSISQSVEAKVTIFAGGISEVDNAKLVLYGSNEHVMTGSLNISGSVVFNGGGKVIPNYQDTIGAIDLKSGPGGWAELQSYDENQYIWVDDTGAYIGTNWYSGSHGWSFDRSGSFNTAGDIYIPDSSKLYGTASWALNTLTASYVANAISSSYALTASYATSVSGTIANAVSSAYANTASWAINALTASSADNFTIRGSLTGSDALFTGTITAQILNVQYVTASTEFVTGSSKFGSQLTDTHQFTGSVSITGSLTVNGTLTATSSYALSALSSSYSLTSSYVQLAQTASFVAQAQTASYVLNAISSSFASTASYAQNSQTASYVLNAITASYVDNAQTASYVLNAISSSFSNTASYIQNSQTASFVTASNVWGPFGSNSVLSSSYALTASYATSVSGTIANAVSASYAATASWAINSLTASYVLQAVSASYATTASYVLQAVSSSFSTNAATASYVNLAQTASYVQNAQTASYVLNAVSASYAATASWAINALTASSADNFVVRQDITASNALFSGTITAQRLNVQYITASTEFVTGSSKFGSLLTDTHQFTGSVSITGSLTVNGTLTATSSYSLSALSSSYAVSSSFSQNSATASYVLNAVSSSFASTASYVLQAVSASFSSTASYVQNAQTASYVLNAVSSSFSSTASYVLNAVSSSFASTASFVATASWAQNAVTASYILNAVSSSFASTSSYVLNAVSSSFASTASFVTTAQTASFVTASNVYGPFGSNSIISSSYALTASYSLNAAAVSTFQIATGSVTASVNVVSASFQVTSASVVLMALDRAGALTASRAFLSSSNGTVSGSTLIVYGSGSAQPVFTVQGSQGELFSVSDSLSGSLFSVNDISGLPVIEAFSDNRVLIGSYQAPALYTTVRTTSALGNNIIYQNIPTASYDGAFFDYTVRSGSNARAGQIMAIWSASAVNFTETTTTDFGDTSTVRFTVIVTGSNMALTGSFPTANWTMKTIIRSV